MGLDMYLTARKYVQEWGHHFKDGVIPEDSPANTARKVLNLPFPLTYVEMRAAYWRKANAIHRWFVENVQNGQDDCGKHFVSTEQLKTLLQLCKDVRAQPDRAPELLPTKIGFFFGPTEYGEYYFEDIANTIERLENVINVIEAAEPDYVNFYYYSSW